MSVNESLSSPHSLETFTPISRNPRDRATFNQLILPALALVVGVDLRLRGLPNVDYRLALEYRRGQEISVCHDRAPRAGREGQL